MDRAEWLGGLGLTEVFSMVGIPVRVIAAYYKHAQVLGDRIYCGIVFVAPRIPYSIPEKYSTW